MKGTQPRENRWREGVEDILSGYWLTTGLHLATLRHKKGSLTIMTGVMVSAEICMLY
jgi:hypothetical protein